MYYNDVSTDDVIKLLFEMKKDKHAQRVIRMAEMLRYLEGKLEICYESTQLQITPTANLEDKKS